MAKRARTVFLKAKDVAAPPVKRRPGRPATGPGGERVSDYPAVMIRLPRQTRATLDALSGITGTPVWQLVDRAVAVYVQQLSAQEQRLVSQVKSRRARLTDS